MRSLSSTGCLVCVPVAEPLCAIWLGFVQLRGALPLSHRHVSGQSLPPVQTKIKPWPWEGFCKALHVCFKRGLCTHRRSWSSRGIRKTSRLRPQAGWSCGQNTCISTAKGVDFRRAGGTHRHVPCFSHMQLSQNMYTQKSASLCSMALSPRKASRIVALKPFLESSYLSKKTKVSLVS